MIFYRAQQWHRGTAGDFGDVISYKFKRHNNKMPLSVHEALLF
jgi:hypothetical protein